MLASHFTGKENLPWISHSPAIKQIAGIYYCAAMMQFNVLQQHRCCTGAFWNHACMEHLKGVVVQHGQ